MFTSENSASFSLDWIQQIPSSIVIIDTNFKLISASPTWQSNFQLDLQQIKGKNFVELFPEFAQELQIRLKYSLDGLRDIKFKYNAKDCHYSSKDSIWHLNPWKDGYGKIIGVIIKVDAISKTQELELELNRTRLILNQKSSVAKIGSWEYDVQNEKLHWTPVVNKIYGVPADFEPTLEKAYRFYLEGKCRKTIKFVFSEAKNSGKPWNEKLQLKQQNGKVIWVNSIGRPKYSDGKCTRIIGTLQNISDTVEQDFKQLKPQPFEYPLFEKVPFGLAIIDYKSGNFVNINHQFTKLSGFEKSHFLQHHFKDYVNTGFRNKSEDLMKQLNEIGAFKPVKFTFVNKLKQNLNLRVTGTMIESSTGTKGILCTIENISAQANLEHKLKKTIAAARTRNEQLLKFAHMVSHNLKTHATNFSLLLTFLNNETNNKQRNKYMKMLFRASDNLSETIKGLREIVAVNSNINKEKKPINLNESLFTVEQNVAGLLKETNGKIINEIPETTIVKALPAYLNSILTNLITNSIKYKMENKNPIIILSIEEVKNYTILNVEDNGLGIDLEKYGHKLFGLYNTFHRNKESRGIGLYLIKNQIEAMNGKITVASTPDQGSTFKIYFNKK